LFLAKNKLKELHSVALMIKQIRYTNKTYKLKNIVLLRKHIVLKLFFADVKCTLNYRKSN